MVFFDPTKGPTERARKQPKQLAPRRFTTLDGVRVGLLSNSKLNADNILLAIGDLLAKNYKLKSMVHERKQNFSMPAPDPIVDMIASQSDVVLAGIGD
jgi:hypothetical protein